jgi:hypothetical protein
MRIQKTIMFLSFFLISITLMSQVATPAFAKFLIEKSDYQGVINLKLFDSENLNPSQQDSMHFYNAWANFHLQNIPRAIQSFDMVSEQSKFYKQSRLFCSWSLLYSGEPDLSLQKLLNNREHLIDDSEVFHLQESAIYLIDGNYEKAKERLKIIESNRPIYSDQINALNKIAESRIGIKQKSPVVAAVLSALIPGAGKIYAQEKGAGISSFLILAGLGGAAAENILKSGFNSWNSILFTSIFAAFYAGNVYGSAISVRTYRERYNENYKQAVLATVIIPLRDFYR